MLTLLQRQVDKFLLQLSSLLLYMQAKVLARSNMDTAAPKMADLQCNGRWRRNAYSTASSRTCKCYCAFQVHALPNGINRLGRYCQIPFDHCWCSSMYDGFIEINDSSCTECELTLQVTNSIRTLNKILQIRGKSYMASSTEKLCRNRRL